MNIIKKAISTCRRNIVGKQKGGVITRMVKTTGKSCDISIDASVPTACWSFESDKHIIKVGISLKTSASNTTAPHAKMVMVHSDGLTTKT